VALAVLVLGNIEKIRFNILFRWKGDRVYGRGQGLWKGTGL